MGKVNIKVAIMSAGSYLDVASLLFRSSFKESKLFLKLKAGQNKGKFVNYQPLQKETLCYQKVYLDVRHCRNYK